MDFNVRRSLLQSAARTAATACPLQTGETAEAIRLYLNITAASGTGGLAPVIRGYDLISGATVSLTTGGTPVTAIGCYCYDLALSAGAAAGNVKESVSRRAPVAWDVNVTVGDTSSYTYSLSAEVLT